MKELEEGLSGGGGFALSPELEAIGPELTDAVGAGGAGEAFGSSGAD